MEHTYHINGVETKEGELIIRHGEAQKLNQFQYKGYIYQINSTDSLIALAERKAKDHRDGVIFSTGDGFKMIVDTSVQDRPQDRAQYDFKPSVPARAWCGVLAGDRTTYNVRDFVEFLRHRPVDEIDIMVFETLLECAQNMKYAITNEVDHSYKDLNNYTISIKREEAMGAMTLPRIFCINLELIEGSGFFQTVEIDLELKLASNPGDGTWFILTCPKWEVYQLNALEYEVAKVKAALPEFLVIHGDVTGFGVDGNQ